MLLRRSAAHSPELPVVLLARMALDRTGQRKALAAFCRHFDFHQLDDRRLWRRLADVERVLGE
jgi:hypothetical protein